MLNQLQSLLLLLPPEIAHKLAFQVGKILQSKKLYKDFEKQYESIKNIKPVKLAEMNLQHPIGLAAGFDKNAELIALLSHIGFSFLEVGTITPLAQSGNPKPRLFRIKDKKSLVNRLGFNNHGMEIASKNIKVLRPQMRSGVKLGVNIGKNKNTPNELAVKDYEQAYNKLQAEADYVVVNLSSPNTPGLRDLQSATFLQSIRAKLGKEKPLFVKFAPELEQEELRDLLQAASDLEFQGVILTNTLSVASDKKLLEKYQTGGISGNLLRIASREALLKARKHSKLPIVSVGGIDSSDEILWRLQNGASAVQIYTAMIYQGQNIVFEMLKGLK
jgi:dihydroorotate dehydrogenase